MHKIFFSPKQSVFPNQWKMNVWPFSIAQYPCEENFFFGKKIDHLNKWKSRV